MADDVAHLAKTLKLLAADRFSEATAAAVNRVAHAAHVASTLNLKRDFTLRNKYTLGSMIFFKASPKKDASKIDALTGSKSPYLDEQESGGDAETKSGGKLRSIPSLQARGGNWSRPVGSRFWRKKMGTVGHRGAGGRMTPKGSQFFWLTGGSLRMPALFLRTPKGMFKVYSALHGPIHVKATHWHSSAMDRFGRPEVMNAAWARELNIELSKLGAK